MFRLQIILLCFIVSEISGHGMMLDPAGRSSLWRYDKRAPTNYDDNSNYCGGASVQWGTYKGKCGVCGDPFGAPRPQSNENTGRYGRGIVAKTYKAGSVINVQANLTTNHLGYFLFSLCKLSNPSLPESGEECFQPLRLVNGQEKYLVKGSDRVVYSNVQLPSGLTCDRCVLRWHYTTGNNWGACGDGTYKAGCGPQETFRSCADIAIV